MTLMDGKLTQEERQNKKKPKTKRQMQYKTNKQDQNYSVQLSRDLLASRSHI